VSALIPAAPWVCRFLPCSKAQTESPNLRATGEYTQFRQRVFALLTRPGRLKNRTWLTRGANQISDSRSFGRYRLKAEVTRF
jgi:hypothetical protein